MAKKSAKTPTQSKAKNKKAPTKRKAMNPPAATAKAGAKSGMWKILEQKQAQQKQMEQARSEGHHTHGHGSGHEFHANPRDPRFSKFAGPRRKAG